MHYLENNNITKENLVSVLYEQVPEFNEVSVFNKEDEVYPIFGEFGRFLISNIDNENVIKISFKLISNFLEKHDEYIETLIVLEIFQPIYDSDVYTKKVFPFLSDKAKLIFNENEIKYKNFFKI